MLGVIGQLMAPPWWKAWAATFVGVLSWGYPAEAIRVAVVTSIGLLLFDLVVGTYSSIGVRKEKLEAAKLIRSAMKMFVYSTFPVVCWKALTASGLPKEASISIGVAIATLAVATEFVSITKHLSDTNLLPVPAWLSKFFEDRITEIHKGSEVMK